MVNKTAEAMTGVDMTTATIIVKAMTHRETISESY
jgi:hypothetical protein